MRYLRLSNTPECRKLAECLAGSKINLGRLVGADPDIGFAIAVNKTKYSKLNTVVTFDNLVVREDHIVLCPWKALKHSVAFTFGDNSEQVGTAILGSSENATMKVGECLSIGIDEEEFRLAFGPIIRGEVNGATVVEG